MVRFTATAAILALAMTVSAVPAPMPALPDPAGADKVGNQNHAQFIGGQCINSNDCALDTACCATFGSIGLCSGLDADFQAGKSGCGFGDSGSVATPATSSAAPAATDSSTGNSGTVTVDPSAAGSQNVGTGSGQQFITGQCVSDADCASGCCATDGKCAARAVVESPQDPRECGFTATLARM
ncbi:hypothetical protein GGR51DRAFT_414145 [Nemania sp. FL0031]|nr:hypothetical protein GGR51DRAFT_414145 [Nemania sp. FL0031]